VAKATLSDMGEHTRSIPAGDVQFYQPIVVLEGALYEAFLNDESKIVLAKAKWIPVSFAYRSPNYEHRRLTIVVVEEPHLSEFLRKLDETLGAWALPFDQRPDLATSKGPQKA
jgi:hypothetical protein